MVFECHPSVHAAPFFPSTRLDSNLKILKFNVLTSFHFLPFPFLLLSFPDFAFISSLSFQFLACSCHIPVIFFHLASNKPNTGSTTLSIPATWPKIGPASMPHKQPKKMSFWHISLHTKMAHQVDHIRPVRVSN